MLYRSKPMDLHDLAESIATEASEDSGLDDRPHADPAVLAVAYLGLRLVPSRTVGPCLIEDRIYYPRHACETAGAWDLAHETGHFLARQARARLTPDEEELVASRIGCALLLPRRAFLRDVTATRADPCKLVELWPLVTLTIVRRRLDEVALF